MRTLTHAIHRLRRNEDGGALVELALLLPLLTLVFAVTIEGGRLLWSYQSATAGVRDASRYLARVAPMSICDAGGSVSGYAAQLDTIVRQRIDGGAIFPTGITLNSVTPSLACETGTYRISTVPVVSVSANLSITFPFSDLIEFAGGSQPTVTTTITDQHRVFGT